MSTNLNGLYLRLRGVMGPRVKSRAQSIVFQIKGVASLGTALYLLRHHLPSAFPKMAKPHRLLLSIYILGEAGLLGGVSSNSGQLTAAMQSLQNTFGSDQETSEMTSLQLQMLMDVRSKLLQTASDMEKSMSDTNMAIAGNIKQ
jgi:hypothetical protein